MYDGNNRVLVHSAVGTRMHASFTRRSALSGPMCASCAPAARGGQVQVAFDAKFIFIIFIIFGTNIRECLLPVFQVVFKLFFELF